MVQLKPWEVIRIFAVLRTADAVSRHLLISQKDRQYQHQTPPVQRLLAQRLLAQRLLAKLHQAPTRSPSKPQESTNTASKATPSISKK